jgi:hypothetical protein
MVFDADENSDGQVSFEEFVHIAEKTNVKGTTSAKLTQSSNLWQSIVKGTSTIKVQKGALSVLKTIEDFDANKSQIKQAASLPSNSSAFKFSPISVCMNDAAPSESRPEVGAEKGEGENSAEGRRQETIMEKMRNALKQLDAPEQLQTEKWKEDRSDAQSHATVGLGLLCAVAVIRVVLFKL